MTEPGQGGIVEELRLRTGRRIEPVLAGPRALADLLRGHAGRPAQSVEWGIDPAVARRAPSGRRRTPGAVGLTPLPLPKPARDEFDGSGGLRTAVSAANAGLAAASGAADPRAEIAALQGRVHQLEGQLSRADDVIRRLCALLVRKNLVSRDEMVDWLR